jgi:hypothetical protein
MEQVIQKTKNNNISESFKQKWVKALRSGKYKQGNGSMYDTLSKSYDPIGVAHRIVGVKNTKIANKAVPTKQHRFVPSILASDTNLVEKLIDFNDRGMSFKWIASYIEKHL